MTPEEYLVRERLAETRSQYYQGQIFAMAGASEEHNLSVTNLVASLVPSLRQRKCRVYATDMRVLVNETGLYTYPDVVVVCGKPILADKHGDILTNPVVLIEVLSESTEDYDRGGNACGASSNRQTGNQFHQYMRIPSLQEYLTVSQTQMLIDQRIRQADNSWLIREFVPATGKVSVKSLGVELDFAEVYDQVEFAEPTA